MLYHVTPLKNRASILRGGLLTAKATRKPRIWLCGISKLTWAYRHVQTRHKTYRVVILRVNLTNRQVTRFRRGVYYSLTDIPAGLIK